MMSSLLPFPENYLAHVREASVTAFSFLQSQCIPTSSDGAGARSRVAVATDET